MMNTLFFLIKVKAWTNATGVRRGGITAKAIVVDTSESGGGANIT